MTEAGSVYGQALYDLAKDENVSEVILSQLEALGQSFRLSPEFLTLLASPSLTKEERCGVLEESFRGQIHGYLLNFLKLLTEEGYIRHFFQCCGTYESCFDRDNGILRVTAVTAVEMGDGQKQKLMDTLHSITGKQIRLSCRIDPAVLGGIRLDYQDTRLEATVAHRLETIRTLLKQTTL